MTTINTPTGGDDGLKSKRGKLINKTKNEVSNNLDTPEELRDYREAWKEKIRDISAEDKKKIIEAAEKIPVKVETDSDGSRLINFKLKNKTYKILDPNLRNHTDEQYGLSYYDSVTNTKKYMVKMRGMLGDNVDNWGNQKLKEYVKEKQLEGLHIVDREIDGLLRDFGELAHLGYTESIAMLMYLTGMDGLYWLKEDKDGGFSPEVKDHYRSLLKCGASSSDRWISSEAEYDFDANLCMIAVE